MDPELNPDEPVQLRSELSAEDQAAADKAAADAFTLAFGEESSGTPSDLVDDTKPATDTTTQAAAVEAPAGETTPQPKPTGTKGKKTPDATDDPFKDLSPQARELLAEVPTLRRNLDAMQNRIAPTQRKLAETERELAEARRLLAEKNAAPAVQAAPSELEQRVRGELPEVADLIAEQVAAALGKREDPKPKDTPAPATTAAADAPDPAIEALAKVHPDWDKTMLSSDFKLYVAAKGTEHFAKIDSTDDPIVIASEISEFKAHQRQAQERARQASETTARRNTRTERAVTPGGRASPPAGDQKTEHDAMVEAFNSP